MALDSPPPSRRFAPLPTSPSLPLTSVVEPEGLVSLNLPVLKLALSLLGVGVPRVRGRDRDSVLSVAVGWVSLGVKGVVGYLVLGNVVEGVLEGPVCEGVALGEAAADGGVLELR